MAVAGNSGAGWAQLRQQARALESQTENLLHTYSQFSTAPNIPAKASEDERNTELKLQELLEKRETVISQLNRLLDSESTLSSSALKQSNLSLLSEKLSAHRRDLSRLTAALTAARSRAHLLTNVRDDIDAYHSANLRERAEAEYMLEERERLDRSHEGADGALSQAYAVRESLLNQGEMLSGIQRSIEGVAGIVPGIHALIGRISAKRRRDGAIMGAFIAVCFLVFWFFL